jgi:hypothetical protein
MSLKAASIGSPPAIEVVAHGESYTRGIRQNPTIFQGLSHWIQPPEW